MKEEIGSLICRKFIATLFSGTVVTILFLYLMDVSRMLDNRWIFISIFLAFFMYIGGIILVYGNLVSISAEKVQRKLAKEQSWLYVIILGIFGLANGLLFQEITFALLGFVAAVLYAIIDKLLEKRLKEEKSIKAFLLIPISVFFLSWGYCVLTFQPLPPLTMEEAVKFVTSGDGTFIDNFPKEIGEWQGTVDGYAYQVKRETSAEELEEGKYKVIFTETWGNEKSERAWVLTYIVERGTSSIYSKEGIMPPYYKK